MQIRPSTAPEVLEERRKAVAEAAKKIEEVEALCAKAIGRVSQDWEALMEDLELEKFAEDLRTT